MIRNLTAYEKLKSSFDHEITSLSHTKPILPACRLTCWTDRIKWQSVISSVAIQQWWVL